MFAVNRLFAKLANLTTNATRASAILKSSTFFAPLTHSLALTRGSGSATFTRATTATVFDNENKLITVPSGCSRHVGARYVRNLLTATEFSAGVTDAPTRSGLLSSTTLSGFAGALAFGYDGATATYAYKTGSVANAVNVFSVYVEMTDGNAPVFGSSSAASDFNIVIGGSVVNGSLYTTTNLGNNLYRISCSSTPSSSGNVGIIKYSSSTPRTFKVTGYQLENVTGQSDQTASEYVSVGVLSAPYHGLAVDGIKAFDTNKDGSPISRTSLEGFLSEPAATNNILYCRDLTQATAWTASNITPVKTATGIDNVANSATTLTAAADNGTILQPRTLASAARSSSAYVKRRTGSGSVYFTRDGGTTWTDITSSLSSSAWYRAKIENSSVTNPSVGFKLATSGNAIDVDYVQDEAGAKITEPIATTTATVTRNATTGTYTLPSGFDTSGTLYAEITLNNWSSVSGTAIGDGTNGPMVLSTSNMGIQAKDGTNTVNGPTGTPTGKIKVCVAWGGSKMQVFVNGNAGTEGNYDGSFGLSNIALMASSQGKIKNVHWIASKLSVNDCKAITR